MVLGTVDNVVSITLRGKANGCFGDAGNVIGMRIPVHIIIHVEIGLLAIFVAEYLAEAIRQNERRNALVDKLIYSKRLGQALQHLALLIGKLISTHGSPLRTLGIMASTPSHDPPGSRPR